MAPGPSLGESPPPLLCSERGGIQSDRERRLIRYECDKCGARLTANDAGRFIVKIEAYAAAGPIEWSAADLARDRSRQLQTLVSELQRADPDEVEDQTYRSLRFDLCAVCHRAFLKAPLGSPKSG